MQLLLKRAQYSDGLGFVRFKLWAKFELTGEEDELLTRYHARKAVLSEGDPQRDLIRSAKYAAGLALLAFVLLYAVQGTGLGRSLLIGLAAFAELTYCIYQQIREEIRVSDIIAGRHFACRSVLTLIEKERTVTEMAVVFRQFLEAMKTWGGAEAIDIEPAHKPTVRVLEPRHAAA